MSTDLKSYAERQRTAAENTKITYLEKRLKVTETMLFNSLGILIAQFNSEMQGKIANQMKTWSDAVDQLEKSK